MLAQKLKQHQQQHIQSSDWVGNSTADPSVSHLITTPPQANLTVIHASGSTSTPSQQHIKAIVETLSDKNNTMVSTAFNNEKGIEHDSKLLQTQLATYQKQTKQWLSLVDQLNSSLKSLGDLTNWSGVIERDMQEIALTLAKVSPSQ
ncbi:hypothetical protein BATDEDRAFT_91571 [Batrachochytrium dendrobatidis JAM81]|uniref:Biogenesis of lysosome-related organelles complex 1 subunit 1 n=1 Tax=Batrachochytrium dendrobatidis (strain JAM81 / FGSC 10211) TaxID=684364 RepID=F4PAP0_BATDJ|nr:uncharacterized protein BATDEDRAFT_91571 [Batrachochytrium dendrobatidis JAM81]EGF77576.1 hypothetical protein BATDEDRAFT_91571 [Batrachochytrium dendrobatidis JAM81]KAJ8323503.1 biogenesis of lysosome- organelles complex 1 subunit 1 [Batrachochytrium dendrobatidis]KAK5666174.1 biogenesis of lysosome-related organelles complex 1 subunit 1 [Batrachochytrium dendrobatidis]|eukprot:XP_006681763.1 hypothetical protein BATDEDRAFT_91571 [Batrachochytrium dendrobatidis JAM81]